MAAQVYSAQPYYERDSRFKWLDEVTVELPSFLTILSQQLGQFGTTFGKIRIHEPTTLIRHFLIIASGIIERPNDEIPFFGLQD